MNDSHHGEPTKVWPLAAWAAVVAALALLLYGATEALTPFLLAVVLAYMGVPIVDWLERHKFGRAAAAGLVLLLLLLIVLLVPILILPVVISQSIEVLREIPATVSTIRDWVSSRVPMLDFEISEADALAGITENLSLGGAVLDKAGGVFEVFESGVEAVIGVIGVILITPLVAFYMLRDWHSLIRSAARNIPARILPAVTDVSVIADRTLSEFLRGQLMVMLVMAFVYSALLTIAGTPFSIAIGVITGLLCFIPFVGVLFGIVLSVLVTLLDTGPWTDIVWPVVALLAGSAVESVWLTPKIIDERTGLGPIAILLALSVMGALLGFVGVLVAIPVAAVAVALWRHYHPALTGHGSDDAV